MTCFLANDMGGNDEHCFCVEALRASRGITLISLLSVNEIYQTEAAPLAQVHQFGSRGMMTWNGTTADP